MSASGSCQIKPISKALVLNWGRFLPPGDVWQHLETFLILMAGEWSIIIGHFLICWWQMVGRIHLKRFACPFLVPAGWKCPCRWGASSWLCVQQDCQPSLARKCTDWSAVLFANCVTGGDFILCKSVTSYQSVMLSISEVAMTSEWFVSQDGFKDQMR